MAFESRVYALRIEQHPNADRLELAAIGGFRCVVGKGSFVDGDLAAYIPEAAVCPDWLIAELGLEGKLAGSKKNRVKAVKLRGSLSQGLVYPVSDGMIRGRQVAAGDDVTELLELVKYEPPIPISMQGEVRAAHGATLKFDIEDFKKYPEEFRDGEPVVITEKLHGTWCCLGWHPEHGAIVTSKGMSDKGPGAEAERGERRQPVRPHVGPRTRRRSSRRVPGSPATAGHATSWARCTAAACRTCTTANPIPFSRCSMRTWANRERAAT